MKRSRTRRVAFIFASAVVAASLFAAGARAQVGSALIARPWQPGQTVNATNFFLGTPTDSETVGDETNLARGVSFGRFRLDPNDPQGLTVGWLYDQLEIDSTDPLLPERLNQTAVALGKNLGEVWDGWNVSIAGGFGFAGDLPYADGDAVFGLGSIVATKQLDQRTALTVLLDFDGSRSVLPDVPLPGVSYSVFVSPTLRYALGVPFSTLFWKPDDRWTIDITYALPIGGRAEAEYRFDDNLFAFVAYNASTRGYTLNDTPGNRRIFFEQNRAEAGLRLRPNPDVTWIASVGWAFGQEFTTGFDTIDDDSLRDLDDAAFLRVGLNFNF
ncbi:MAG: hypothetical protein AAFX76_11485 [Planctomycetota bacterium]